MLPSLAAHLLVALAIELHHPGFAVEPAVELTLVPVQAEPEGQIPAGPRKADRETTRPRVAPPARRRDRRAANPAVGTRSRGRPEPAPGGNVDPRPARGTVSPLLRMRDRFASFRRRKRAARRDLQRPRVTAEVAHAGLQLRRYQDGGKLLRATGKRGRRPGVGETGLLTLASNRIGRSSGRLACDPYRRMRGRSSRTLVLLVDTSGSVVKSRRAPAALVCAAGAALAALGRGHAVAVANFSSSAWFLRPTRDEDAIYALLSLLQRGKTRLPPASLLRKSQSRATPRDFVLISDSAIDNLEQVLPGYARTIAANPHNRALFYVLGQGDRRALARLRRAGFTPDFVERHLSRLAFGAAERFAPTAVSTPGKGTPRRRPRP